MGGGTSLARLKSSSHPSIIREDADIFDNGDLSGKRLKCVETFVRECLRIMKNDPDAVLNFLSNKESRESFCEFVSSKKGENQPEDERIKLVVEQLKLFDENLLNGEPPSDHIDLICRMNKVGEYLLAPAYRMWRAKEIGEVDEAVSSRIAKETVSLPSHRRSSVEKAFSSMKDEEVARIIHCSSWLTKFISAADYVPFGIILVRVQNEVDGLKRRDLSIIYVNNRFESISGYSKVEALGRNPKFLQGPHTDAVQVIQMSLAVQTVSVFEGVVCNYRKNGQTFFNNICYKPIRDKNDHCDYWIGIMEDVTNRRKCSLFHLLNLLPNRIVVHQL
jgi:PAS domain S-box-containing protein